jgi:hypothetical protein
MTITNPTSTTTVPISQDLTVEVGGETLREYASSAGITLRVDRTQGVIHGVKIVGLESLNKRSYTPATLSRAVPLYEGAKVNIDHRDEGQKVSYAQRIGAIKNVVQRDDGLYADFHFNPKHHLAEQLCWDAENAPQNVGFSHDANARTTRRDGRVIVEEILKVNSVDLVANPATTRGLFEAGGDQLAVENQALKESLEALRQELAEFKLKESLQSKANSIAEELKAARLNADDATVVSEAFRQQLMSAPNEAARRALIEDRVKLLYRSASTINITGTSPFQAVREIASDRDSLSALFK